MSKTLIFDYLKIFNKNIFMSILKNISLAFVLITTLAGLTIAQPAISTGNSSSSSKNKTQTGFVSVEGEFSINLPSTIRSFSAPNPVEGVSKNEREFTWDTPQGFFVIDFYDLYGKPESPKTYLATRVDKYIKQIVAEGAIFSNRCFRALSENSFSP